MHRAIRRRTAALALLTLPTLLAALAVTPGPAMGQAAAGRWIGPDGEPLPFRDDAEVLDFLARARVVSSKEITSGINRPHKLLLELDGVRAHAIFRDVDVARPGSHSAAERLFPSHRDNYLFEVAAYETSRLLGIDNVPPARLYEWNGHRGSIQLWIENARSEADRLESGDPPADPAGWHHQRTIMRVFDNLIYNFDRNPGNELLDARGKLWFIDHTRSFKPSPTLPAEETVVVVDASVWRHLRDLADDEIRARLGRYLDAAQLDALLARRRLLIAHIGGLIAGRGEDHVVLWGTATSSTASRE